MMIARDKEDKSDQKKQVGSRRSWRMKIKKSICPDCKLSFRIENDSVENKILNVNKLSKRVDQVSFVLCLLTFLLFNLIFWKFYL